MRSLLRRIFRQPDSPRQDAPARARLEIEAGRPLIYAIGDVHGCYDALLALETRILADARQEGLGRPLIVYLGDYVDRGPASRDVLTHLSSPRHLDGMDRLALCGNHDDAFLRFIRNPADNLAWLDFGGDATLRSYGLGGLAQLRRPNDPISLAAALEAAVPAEHIAFLENLPILARAGDRLFVHAGIRPGVSLAEQVDEDLLWIREPFLTTGPGLPLTVIHGHTAGEEPVFGSGRVCIDTGCYATGRLTALKLTANGVSLL
jgi:serine/threonine protein phosphatase 1